MKTESLVSKLTDITENYVNGNKSDFREAVKKLSKIDLLYLVEYMKDETSYTTQEILGILKHALTN